MPDWVQPLIESGVLGVIVLALGVYIWVTQRIHRKDLTANAAALKECQNLRIDEAKEVGARLLEVADRASEATADLQRTLMESTRADDEFREQVREYTREVRDLTRELGAR